LAKGAMSEGGELLEGNMGRNLTWRGGRSASEGHHIDGGVARAGPSSAHQKKNRMDCRLNLGKKIG